MNTLCLDMQQCVRLLPKLAPLHDGEWGVYIRNRPVHTELATGFDFEMTYHTLTDGPCGIRFDLGGEPSYRFLRTFGDLEAGKWFTHSQVFAHLSALAPWVNWWVVQASYTVGESELIAVCGSQVETVST